MISERYTYLLVDLGCILVPFLASFHPKVNFARHWRAFIVPCALTALFFLVWDALFTHIGVWGFNPRYLTGIYVFNLPLEELLFFIAIPYACVFTYFSISKFVNLRSGTPVLRNVMFAAAFVLLVLALANFFRLYTSVTFFLLALALVFFAWRNDAFLPAFFLSYLVCLLPFFLSNGLLTGYFTEEPVVFYNDAHNLGIRMGSIPLEDAFYAMLMLIMNVAGFEYMRYRELKNAPHLKTLSC